MEYTMHRFIAAVSLLALASCSQVASFEQKAAPQIAQACALFHRAEADPAVQIALAAGTTAGTLALGVSVGAIVAQVRSYGAAFCANGPPVGDATTPAQQAAWLAGVTMQLLGAAGALR
jgi:hypothetical protein